MNYLLDTNVCIALINSNPPLVRAKFDQAIANLSIIYVSSISLFELWYGVSKSKRREFNTGMLVGFLSGSIHRLSFEEEDAPVTGELRTALEASGQRIGEYDMLMAGQALRHGLTLVTANTKEFARIRNLSCENWSK